MAHTDKLIENIFVVTRLMKGNMSYSGDLAHLSILQVQALSFIHKQKKVQMSVIAKNFGIELPSATSLLNKLYSKHLVKRTQDIKDRRIVNIGLTQQGEILLKDAMIERDKKIRILLSYLSEKDKAELLRISEILVREVKAHYGN